MTAFSPIAVPVTAPTAARTTAAAASAANERIEGLAAWRALLILAGVLLHATMGQESLPVFAAINIVSGSFRMGTFFMISGLLSGFALARRASPGEWLRSRLAQLGVPTLFGFAVVCPAIGLIEDARHQRWWALNPYHLWFLVALLAYTLLGYAIHRVDLSWRVFERAERRSATARMLQLAVLAGTGLLSFVLMGLFFPVLTALPAALYPLARELPLLTGYAPAFLLGFTAARVPTIRRTLTASARVPAAILATGAMALAIRWFDPAPFVADLEWSNLVTVTCAAWCPPAAAALILRSAMAIRRVPNALRGIADASFTIYILHYPVIAAVRVLARPAHLGPWETFALLAGVGGLVPFAVHRLLVERSPWLRLLLNGCPIVPRARCASPPPQDPAGRPRSSGGTPRPR